MKFSLYKNEIIMARYEIKLINGEVLSFGGPIGYNYLVNIMNELGCFMVDNEDICMAIPNENILYIKGYKN